MNKGKIDGNEKRAIEAARRKSEPLTEVELARFVSHFGDDVPTTYGKDSIGRFIATLKAVIEAGDGLHNSGDCRGRHGMEWCEWCEDSDAWEALVGPLREALEEE